MRRSIKKSRQATLASILILGLFLRTLVAPGFMLNITAGGLDIVFCDGPVELQDGNSVLHHDQTPLQEEDDKDDASYISSICGFCSTSILGFITTGISPAPVIPAPAGETIHQPVFFSRIHHSSFSIRAPPALS